MFEKEINVLKYLANGINYYTGEKCLSDSILNDPNIRRTLFSICNLLQSNNGNKVKFIAPPDIIENFQYENELNLTQIIDKLSIMYPTMYKANRKLIVKALINKGLLKQETDKNGRINTIATEVAELYGIYNVQKYTNYYHYPYNVVMYNENGQRFILSILKNNFNPTITYSINPPQPSSKKDNEYSKIITVGDTITFVLNNKIEKFKIVSPHIIHKPKWDRSKEGGIGDTIEILANNDGEISSDTPLAKALLGKTINDKFEYKVKNEKFNGTIICINGVFK